MAAVVYCTIGPPLSGAMEVCSIVRVQQLQMLYRRRCCMSVSQCMFGSLCNKVVDAVGDKTAVVGYGTTAKCQTATDERPSQPCMALTGMYKQICWSSESSETNDTETAFENGNLLKVSSCFARGKYVY